MAGSSSERSRKKAARSVYPLHFWGALAGALQALGRAHRIGQSRFQRVWIITQDHSYDQLLQAAQTKKMLQQIAGEGLIELDDAEFEMNDDQIAGETADIIEDDERE